MKDLTSLREVLELATKFEITARDFYTDLASKVSKNMRYLVEELAAEEQEHVELFSDMLKRKDLQNTLDTKVERPASDRKFSDCVHVPDLGENPDDQTVLQYALKREQIAMEQYRTLAEETEPGPLHDLFQFLANEEAEHKNELEVLYYEIVHSGGV
ncbi:MAG: ferritin family protein [Marinosulfonomonas sp.]|nr:ferritin family protein [Marinosulfonomonas sp.]